jgi:hypothetical protein
MSFECSITPEILKTFESEENITSWLFLCTYLQNQGYIVDNSNNEWIKELNNIKIPKKNPYYSHILKILFKCCSSSQDFSNNNKISWKIRSDIYRNNLRPYEEMVILDHDNTNPTKSIDAFCHERTINKNEIQRFKIPAHVGSYIKSFYTDIKHSKFLIINDPHLFEKPNEYTGFNDIIKNALNNKTSKISIHTIWNSTNNNNNLGRRIDEIETGIGDNNFESKVKIYIYDKRHLSIKKDNHLKRCFITDRTYFLLEHPRFIRAQDPHYNGAEIEISLFESDNYLNYFRECTRYCSKELEY